MAYETKRYGAGDGLTTQEVVFLQNLSSEANYDSTLVALITVSATAPADPEVNDLWYDIS